MSNRSLDAVIAKIAQRQHGVVSRSQLVAIGLGRGAIELRLANGRLHAVHPRVYAVGHTALTYAGHCMAGVLAGGPGAAGSHRAAAAVWGFLPPAGRHVEVTGPSRRRSRAGLRFYRTRLPPDELAVHDGIPLTTVPRTLFDLAAVLAPGRLARAVKEVEMRRLWDALSLEDLLVRHPRRPGAAALRAVLAEPGRGITRSELEDLFLAFLDAAGLPRPVTNVWLRVDGIWFEVDCAWHEQRLIVELDGRATHGTSHAFEHDRNRDRRLVAAGWRVMRITWRQLREEPEAVGRDLRAALARAPPARR